jgi:hypothetical protein
VIVIITLRSLFLMSSSYVLWVRLTLLLRLCSKAATPRRREVGRRLLTAPASFVIAVGSKELISTRRTNTQECSFRFTSDALCEIMDHRGSRRGVELRCAVYWAKM